MKGGRRGGGTGGGGRRGESRQKSDTGRRVRGPYSFRQELSGGMRVRER